MEFLLHLNPNRPYTEANLLACPPMESGVLAQISLRINSSNVSIKTKKVRMNNESIAPTNANKAR